MRTKPTKKRNFTEKFREEAVRLALTSDQPHHDTALNLVVGKSTEQVDQAMSSPNST